MTLFSATQSRAKLAAQLMLMLVGFVGSIFFSLHPVLVSAAILAAVVLFFGVRFPAWPLLLYAASLFLFQVPLVAGLFVAVPTAAGALFLTTTVLHMLMTRSSLRLTSPALNTLLWFAVVVLLAGLVNFQWFVSNPRGLVTFWALCTSAVAVGLVLRDERRVWQLVRILIVGTTVVSALAIHESWTGHYNPFGLFPGAEEGRAYALADPKDRKSVV